MSRLNVTLREQQAFIVLLLERSLPDRTDERGFSPTHVRRAAYAHLSVLRDVVAPALQNRFDLTHLVSRSAALTECLTHVLLVPAAEQELYTQLLPPLTALFAAEQSLIAALTMSLNGEQLDAASQDAEEMFEALYGRGELAAERGLSTLGDL